MKKASLLVTLAITMACSGPHGDSHDERAMVYIDAGAIQCEYGGHPTEVTARLLQEQGVEVLASACGMRTDLMVITVCGAGTGDINLHTIKALDLEVAEGLGYTPLAGLEVEAGAGYDIRPCRDRGVYY